MIKSFRCIQEKAILKVIMQVLGLSKLSKNTKFQLQKLKIVLLQ